MMTTDVPDDFDQMVESYIQTYKKAKERKGERASNRKPKEALCRDHIMDMTETQQSSLPVILAFIPPAYMPCAMPLSKLKRIMIDDLRLETHHRGSCLILRVISPPHRKAAIGVVVEDERGDAVELKLYHQEEEDSRKATDIVDVGDVLLVKEPFFEIGGLGEYNVRIDHLSDFIRINE